MNENSPDVIKISDSVARRLKGESESIAATAAARQSAGVPFGSRASGDGLEVRKQHQEELQQWREHLREVERQNEELYKLATDKFAGAVDAVEQKYMKHKCVPVCEEFQHKVLECYQKNPHSPLNCSKLVDAFTRCVHQARKDIIAQ